MDPASRLGARVLLDHGARRHLIVCAATWIDFRRSMPELSASPELHDR